MEKHKCINCNCKWTRNPDTVKNSKVVECPKCHHLHSI